MSLRQRIAADRQLFIGAAMLAAVAVFLVAGFSGSLYNLVSGEDTRTLRATFADSQQIEPGDDVRVDGVEAGQVETVTLDPSGESTTVTMAINESAGDFYEDAGANLRYKTVLGGSFYLDLDRGTAGKPALVETIGVERTSRQVELDDVTAVVGGGAQSGLQTLPLEMADALRDNGAPGQLLDQVAGASPDLQAGLNALRGRSLDRDLQGLVENTSRTVAAIDTPRGDVEAVIEGAGATLAVTSARADDIREMLATGPETQDELNATLDRLGTTLDLADPLVAKLQAPAAQVAPTLTSLRPTLVDADDLLTRAVPLLRALRPAVTSLASSAQRGLSLVEQLEPSLARLDDTILPYLAKVDPGTGRALNVMIGGALTGLGTGSGGQMDSNGHFIRFPATFGQTPTNSLPCQVYFANPDADQVAACNDLESSLETYLNYNPIGETPGTEPPSNPEAAGE